MLGTIIAFKIKYESSHLFSLDRSPALAKNLKSREKNGSEMTDAIMITAMNLISIQS